MSSRFMKFLLVACGTLCVGLGVIGIFLPLMPTTVFLLMAAACYARSSEKFYQKLVNNRFLGVYIRNSREGRGMKRRDKVITLAMLWVSIVITAYFTAHTWWLRLILAAVAIGVTIHVVKIPAFKPVLTPEPDRATPSA